MESSEHRMVILMLCSATRHRLLAVKKSIFFDSVSMSLTSSLKFR